MASTRAVGAIRRRLPGWAMEEREREREREPQSMEERERERDGGGKNRVPPFTWMPRREIIFPKIPLVAQDSFGATRLPR